MDCNHKYIYGFLSKNPNAIHIIENNISSVSWSALSKNKNAIHILNMYPEKIHWPNISLNPSAIDILEKNQDKIDWFNLSSNPSIFEIDYEFLQNRIANYREELSAVCYHPKRLKYFIDKYNYDIGDDSYFI